MGLLIGDLLFIGAFIFDPIETIVWATLSLAIGMAIYLESLALYRGIHRLLQKTSCLKESHGTHEVGRKS